MILCQQFVILKEKYGVSETLKIHVIKHPLGEYFHQMGISCCHTNGEKVESVHSSLRLSEERHGLKTVRGLGTPRHGVISEKSLIFYSSKRAKMTPPLQKIKSSNSSPGCRPYNS